MKLQTSIAKTEDHLQHQCQTCHTRIRKGQLETVIPERRKHPRYMHTDWQDCQSALQQPESYDHRMMHTIVRPAEVSR